MIDQKIIDNIPTALKQLPIWTFTNTDYDPKTDKNKKIPMDPVQLDLGVHRGIASTDNLLTFDTLLKVRHVPKDWLPAFHLDAQHNGWLMVDVEPTGMTDGNPFLRYQYEYVEASRHGGLHGLIHLDIDSDILQKTAIKMHDYETECLINNHFVTLTGFTPSELYQPTLDFISAIPYIESSMQANLEVDDNLVNASLNDVASLSPKAQELFDELNLSPINRPKGVDISEWEFNTLAKHYKQLNRYHHRLFFELSDDDKVAVLYQAALETLPPRKKHHNMFHDSTHNDQVNYLFYTVRRIVESSH